MEKSDPELPVSPEKTSDDLARAAKRAKEIHEQRVRSLKRARKFLRLKIKAEREQKAAKERATVPGQAMIAQIILASGTIIKVEGMAIAELMELTRCLSPAADLIDL